MTRLVLALLALPFFSGCAVFLDDRCPRGLLYRAGACVGIPSDGLGGYTSVEAEPIW